MYNNITTTTKKNQHNFLFPERIKLILNKYGLSPGYNQMRATRSP